MKQQDFENQIRQAFEHYPSGMSDEEIWDNIEPKLKRKKNRRWLIWLLCGLGVLFAGWGIEYAGFFDSQTDAPISALAGPANDKITPSPAIDISTRKTTVEEVEKPIIQSPQNRPEIITNKQNDFTRRSAKPALMTNASLPPTDDTRPNPNMEQTIDRSWTSFNTLPTLNFKVSYLTDEKDEKKDKKNKKKRKIRPLSTQWYTFLQPSAGPMLAYKSLKANEDFDLSSYRSNRRDTEKQLEAYNIAFHVQVENSKGLLITAGLEYQKLVERFDWQRIEINQDPIWGPITITENAQGEVIRSINGTVSSVTTLEQNIRHFNHYNFIYVPVGIGKIWHRKKYSWSVLGGVDLNVAFRMKGRLLNANGAPIRIENSWRNNDFFKKKAGTGLWLALGYYRPFSDQFSWSVTPRIQIPLDDLSKDSYSISQRYFRLSLNVGVRYLLEE